MKNSNKTNDKFNYDHILAQVVKELKLGGKAPNTIKNYVAGIRRFLEFVNISDVNDLTEDHFRDYLFHLHESDMSKHAINTNNSYIRFLYLSVLNKTINPLRVPKCKFPKPTMSFLTEDMIIRLLNESRYDSRVDCIIKLGLSCGFRINEIASLKVRDVDTKSMTIFISESKRNKSRYVPIDRTVLMALKRYSREYHLNIDDYLFTFKNKQKTNNETLRRHFYHYRDKAGIGSNITFHSLRHTFAINYLNSNGQLAHLKYLMGHGSIGTTSLYLNMAYNQKMIVPSYLDSLTGEYNNA